jgi:hypothetical protein
VSSVRAPSVRTPRVGVLSRDTGVLSRDTGVLSRDTGVLKSGSKKYRKNRKYRKTGKMSQLRSKYRRKLAQEGYVILPNRLLPKVDKLVLGGHTLESQHRLVLIALLTCDFKGETFVVGIRSLKVMTGMGDAAIAQAIRDLERMTLLKVSRRKNCLTEYNLTPFYETYLLDSNKPEAKPHPEEPPRYQLSPDLAPAIKAFKEK